MVNESQLQIKSMYLNNNLLFKLYLNFGSVKFNLITKYKCL